VVISGIGDPFLVDLDFVGKDVFLLLHGFENVWKGLRVVGFFTGGGWGR
jgi:hypothetical protein